MMAAMWVGCLGTSPLAQQPQAPPAGQRPLRLGFLPGSSELHEEHLRALGARVASDAQVAEALESEGIEASITLLPASSVRDLGENMSIGRYDIVLAPVSALQRYEEAGYRVVFQLRRDGDAWDSRGALGVQQQSVIFGRVGNPRRMDDPDARWAFVGGDSASGHIYPRLHLMSLGIEPRDVMLRPTEEEVCRMVLNGLADFGATDRLRFDAFEAQRAAAPHSPLLPGFRRSALHIIETTPYFPAPPVLMHRRLADTAAGRALRAWMQEWFEQRRAQLNAQLTRASDAAFARINDDLDRYYRALQAPDP